MITLLLLGCIPPTTWDIQENRELGALDIDCVQSVVNEHPNILKSSLAVVNENFYQFSIETTFDQVQPDKDLHHTLLNLVWDDGEWHVGSGTAGYQKNVPPQIEQQAPAFHHSLVDSIEMRCTNVS